MKKIFSLAVAVMLSAVSFAQTEAGGFFFAPKVGYNAATLTNVTDHYTTQVGLAVGVEVGYQMTDKFGITADVLYSGQGTFCDTKWGDPVFMSLKDNMKLDYLNIPILANFYIVKGLAVKAGIQPGFLVSAKRKVELFKEPETTIDLKDGTNSFDFSIPVGLSYEWKNIIIDARYIFGLTNVNKSDCYFFEDIDFSEQAFKTVRKDNKNGVFQLTLGYKLPF